MIANALLFITVAMLAGCKHCTVGEHVCPGLDHGPCPFCEYR